MGLATDLHREPEEKILAMRLAMEERQVRSRLIRNAEWCAEWDRLLIALRGSMERMGSRCSELRREYIRLRNERVGNVRGRLKEVRGEWKIAQHQLRQARLQWRLLLKGAAIAGRS